MFGNCKLINKHRQFNKLSLTDCWSLVSTGRVRYIFQRILIGTVKKPDPRVTAFLWICASLTTVLVNMWKVIYIPAYDLKKFDLCRIYAFRLICTGTSLTIGWSMWVNYCTGSSDKCTCTYFLFCTGLTTMWVMVVPSLDWWLVSPPIYWCV